MTAVTDIPTLPRLYGHVLALRPFDSPEHVASLQRFHREFAALMRDLPVSADERDRCLSQLEATYGENFTSKFDARSRGCWPWTAGLAGPGGYGSFWVDGRHHPAHRLTYERCIDPVPSGAELHHACDVTSCVRPTHLIAVTHRVNVLLSTNVCAQRAVVTECPQGHIYDETNTVILVGGRRDCRACIRERARRRFAEDPVRREQGRDRNRRWRLRKKAGDV